MTEKHERIIALWAGDSGTGKSYAVANLHNALIFDTDLGGGLAYAQARIDRNRSRRVEAGSFLEIFDYLKRNSRDLKDLTTVAIDHLTTLHAEAVLRHNPEMKEDYGKSYDIASREWKKLREVIRRQDFNIICTAHTKSKYEQGKAVGITTDAAKNIEADMSIVLRLSRTDKYPSNAWVQKWRRDPEDPRGLIPSSFPFTVGDFERLAGPGLFTPREPAKLASEEQVTEVKKLLTVAKVEDADIAKWFKAAGAEAWEEFSAERIDKAISYVRKLIQEATGPDAPTLKKGK
jgi:hypothetical protein